MRSTGLILAVPLFGDGGHALKEHGHHLIPSPPGATLRDVQDYAGHKDPRTTRRYDHARDSLDRNAAHAVAVYLA